MTQIEDLITQIETEKNEYSNTVEKIKAAVAGQRHAARRKHM